MKTSTWSCCRSLRPVLAAFWARDPVANLVTNVETFTFACRCDTRHSASCDVGHVLQTDAREHHPASRDYVSVSRNAWTAGTARWLGSSLTHGERCIRSMVRNLWAAGWVPTLGPRITHKLHVASTRLTVSATFNGSVQRLHAYGRTELEAINNPTQEVRQHKASTLLSQAKTGTYCTGGWMGLGATLKGTENLAQTGVPSPDISDWRIPRPLSLINNVSHMYVSAFSNVCTSKVLHLCAMETYEGSRGIVPLILNEYGAMVEWYWQGKTEVLGEEHYTTCVVDEWMSMEHLWNLMQSYTFNVTRMDIITYAPPVCINYSSLF
jgi:hypothetical protein